MNVRFPKQIICIILCLPLVLGLIPFEVSAASGTLYESESNNTYTTADTTYNDYDSYGYITSQSDEDWWKITFTTTGQANFWLGSIPSGCDYELRLYASNGTTILYKSLNGNSNDELITCPVTSGTVYYVKVYPSTAGTPVSSTDSYLFRCKVYPSKTVSGVPLYQQPTVDTCGCTSGRMVLASHGINLTHSEYMTFVNDIIAYYGDDYTYVYINTLAINDVLEEYGKTGFYHYTDVGSYSLEKFQNFIINNLLNDCPVQLPLVISNTNYFPYTSGGHYVVIKGMQFSSDGTCYFIVNDPHYSYCNTYTVPASAIRSYNQAHSSYVIAVKTLYQQ